MIILLYRRVSTRCISAEFLNFNSVTVFTEIGTKKIKSTFVLNNMLLVCGGVMNRSHN